MFTVPNLDCLTCDAKELHEVAHVLRLLADYADRRANAMQHRERGNVGAALALERQNENRYSDLPEWARW